MSKIVMQDTDQLKENRNREKMSEKKKILREFVSLVKKSKFEN